jgi:hypothetical protein
MCNKMATRINRIKTAGHNQSVPIKLVIGHGTLIAAPNTPHRIPPGRYLIFLGRPGHFLNSTVLFRNPQILNENYISGVLTRKADTRPKELAEWSSHFYGPGDQFPELHISLFDLDEKGKKLPGTAIDKVSGVRDLRTGQTTLHNYTIHSLRDLMLDQGPGIYIICSCRASAERSVIRPGESESRAHRNFSRGLKTRMSSLRDPQLNVLLQTLENIQSRYAKLKRARSSSSSPPSAKRPKLAP